jgi:hypothetical protein
MLLPDVNVLVYAHRRDAPDHARYLAWLESTVNSDQAYGLADLVLSGFIRVVTHPRVFNPASFLDDALAFVNVLRARDNCVPVVPRRAISCLPRTWPRSRSNPAVNGSPPIGASPDFLACAGAIHWMSNAKLPGWNLEFESFAALPSSTCCNPCTSRPPEVTRAPRVAQIARM